MYGKGVVTTDAEKAERAGRPFYGSPLMAERARAGLDQLLGPAWSTRRGWRRSATASAGSTVQALAYSGGPARRDRQLPRRADPGAGGGGREDQGEDPDLPGRDGPLRDRTQIDAFLKSMNEAEFDYEFISYAGAVHAFTNPDADQLARANRLQGASATTRRPTGARGRT